MVRMENICAGGASQTDCSDWLDIAENIGMTEYEAAVAQETFFHHDRETVRELAKLWDPAIPADQNTAYIERAKELEKELETALFTALEIRGREDAA